MRQTVHGLTNAVGSTNLNIHVLAREQLMKTRQIEKPFTMTAKKKENFQMVPYDPLHDGALLDMERKTPQGFLVKLELIRSHFLSRALTFEHYKAYTVLNEAKTPVAGGIGAEVPICINKKTYAAGFGFDMQVSPAHRNMGIGRELAQHIRQDFFMPRGLYPQYTTLKAGNMPMLHLLSRSYRNTFIYEFLYLTFPTAKSIRVEKVEGPPPSFQVGLLSSRAHLTDYYELTDSGLGLWYTHKIYQLRVKSVNPVISGGMWLGNRFIRTNKYVPDAGSVLKTATIFNLNQNNIHTLPAVSLHLYQQGINFMQICCLPNDSVYRAIRKSALNSYSYYLVSTQELSLVEELKLDVRCL